MKTDGLAWAAIAGLIVVGLLGIMLVTLGGGIFLVSFLPFIALIGAGLVVSRAG